MILSIHIAIALTSLATSTYLFFKPSRRGISLSTWLVTATLSSGLLLAVTQSGKLVHVCISGLIYSTATIILTLSARHKLTRSI